MKTAILSGIIIILFSGQIFAQGGKFHEKRDEIKKKQIEFIIKELQLTEKEKKAFVPIYNKFNDEKEALYKKRRINMRNFHQNSLNMSDEKLIDLADLFVDIDVQLADLGKIYNEKFKKVLPPIKIILLYKAEHEFKKELMKKYQHIGPPGKRP